MRAEGHSPSAPPDPFRLLLLSSRPALRTFFGSLPFELVGLEADPRSVADEAAEAAAAVVDVSLEPAPAIEACRELHRRHPDLPITAVVCCPHSITPWTLRRLFDAGVIGVLDLRATLEEAARVLDSVARGSSVLHVQLRRGHRELLHDLLTAPGHRAEAQKQLLTLVALGLSDREIGARLHLSPHTVKHQIEQLRRELHVRNRTELAAWAGEHGFYDAAETPNGSRTAIAPANGLPLGPSGQPKRPPI